MLLPTGKGNDAVLQGLAQAQGVPYAETIIQVTALDRGVGFPEVAVECQLGTAVDLAVERVTQFAGFCIDSQLTIYLSLRIVPDQPIAGLDLGTTDTHQLPTIAHGESDAVEMREHDRTGLPEYQYNAVLKAGIGQDLWLVLPVGLVLLHIVKNKAGQGSFITSGGRHTAKGMEQLHRQREYRPKLGQSPYFSRPVYLAQLLSGQWFGSDLYSYSMLRSLLCVYLGLLLLALPGQAQTLDTFRIPPPMQTVALDSVGVLPSAIDTKGWLLLDKDIQLELDGAVRNIYNFKYDRAEKQFRSLRRRYPNHPMPYFLLGLSTWWKIIPTQFQTLQYDKLFLAYMDTAVTKAQKMYDADNANYEASFFLSAAYGFDARLHAERHDWRKATVSSRRSLNYLKKSQEANGLSPEFQFGQALFNYYAVWIPDNYPLLKPVLLFFPRGDKALGMQQLRSVANNGFYTATEARVFLMRILKNEENNAEEAMPVARYLATTYPDNGYFQRYYAYLAYDQGEFSDCERVSREILDKINRGLPGYEGTSGRYASYFLGYLMQNRYRDYAKAKDYYQRCIVFSESTGDTSGGFYLFANANLARLAVKDKDTAAAQRYFAVVVDKADRKSELYKEAKIWLKKNSKA